MGWFQTLQKKRAAKGYARYLPIALKQGWGASDYYTPAQIRAAVDKLGLDANYLAVGYAAFLPKEQFQSHADELKIRLSYEESRALFLRYLPPDSPQQGWQTLPLSLGMPWDPKV